MPVGPLGFKFLWLGPVDLSFQRGEVSELLEPAQGNKDAHGETQAKGIKTLRD